MNPFEDQQQAIDKLQQYKVGALLMEAGTGKTLPAVNLVNSAKPDYVLYFAPYRAINAQNEKESTIYQVNKWGGFSCTHDFVGIESISNSDRIYLELRTKLEKAHNPFIVVDESLKIKNAHAKRTQRIIELSKMAQYKLILNGTPLSRNLLDIWSQMYFLSPTILNMDQAEFKNTFCEYKKITMHKPGTYRTRSKEWIVKYHNLDYLYSLIEPYVFFSDLSLDVNLQFINISYSLSDEEKKEHERIKETILENEWLMMKPNFFLEITQKLQNNYSRSDEKFDLVSDILRREPNTLIVAKYIETQQMLAKKFPKARVLSWQKDAFALNLQDYHNMIIFDKHWDYALFDQIIHRIYRRDQKHNCIVYRLTGNVGLENMMDSNVDRKGDLLKEFKKLSLEEFKKIA